MPTKASLNFTKSALDNLPPPATGKRAEYHDSKVPGLRLRHTASGHKSFCVVGWNRKAQKPDRFTIGAYPACTVEAARQEARKWLGRVALGIDPREERREQRQRVPLAAMFEDYMAQHSSVAKRTAKEDRATFERNVRASLGQRSVRDITRGEIAAVHSAITRRGRLVLANRVLALLSSLFSWGIQRGYAETNPAKGIKKNKEHPRDRYLLPEEIAPFFEAVEAEPNPVIRDFVLMCLYTGQRRSNVLEMRWSDIDFLSAKWRIPMTKNGTPHSLPLPAPASALLEARGLVRESQFVFPGVGAQGHLAEPKSGWQRIVARMRGLILLDYLRGLSILSQEEADEMRRQVVGRPDVVIDSLSAIAAARSIELPQFRGLRIHDLRRTNGSYQAMTGASLPQIGKALNHKSVQATQIYAHLHDEATRTALDDAITRIEELRGSGRSGMPAISRVS